MIVLGGINPVAVRISNAELPPFWGATLRIAGAAVLFWIVVFAKRLEIPKGRALTNVLVFGVLTIGLSFAFLYWALVFLPASLTIVIESIGPLLTLFFAWLHRQETFRWSGFLGGVIAIIGIFIGMEIEPGASIPLLPILAVVVSVATLAEGTVLFKSYPRIDPLMVNALALTIGAAMLLLISVVAGEQWILPTTIPVWISYAYLVVGGSVILFHLYLYVLERWTASATSYAFLLFPIVTILVAAWLLDEVITIRFLFGSLIVLVGVWLGAIARPK